MKSITIPSKSWAFTSRSKGTVRDSLVNRLQQGCGCIGCKRNVGALGVGWPCTLASCNVVCMIEVVW
ncbi:hypothetical protein QVD17_42347 [Tagetes erecta]|uniref:Uncharacterized protein n=1 Tax=Tagetes erecta TaxID=13708 RepID=A0AAD8NFB7_TARER|nr:hypothetical protein QVD17_42347 [Tagetes erecta]